MFSSFVVALRHAFLTALRRRGEQKHGLKLGLGVGWSEPEMSNVDTANPLEVWGRKKDHRKALSA